MLTDARRASRDDDGLACVRAAPACGPGRGKPEPAERRLARIVQAQRGRRERERDRRGLVEREVVGNLGTRQRCWRHRKRKAYLSHELGAHDDVLLVRRYGRVDEGACVQATSRVSILDSQMTEIERTLDRRPRSW